MRISINAKCSDLCFCTITDDNGETIYENDGYVPKIPFIGGGDYVEIEIDLETGKVIGFDKEMLSKFLERSSEEYDD